MALSLCWLLRDREISTWHLAIALFQFFFVFGANETILISIVYVVEEMDSNLTCILVKINRKFVCSTYLINNN